MKARHTTLFKLRASAYIYIYIWCLHSHTSPMSFMPAVSQPLLPWSWEIPRCLGCYMQIITAWKSSSFLCLPMEGWAAFQGHYTDFGSLRFCTDHTALLPCLRAPGTRNCCCHTVSHHSPLSCRMASAGTFYVKSLVIWLRSPPHTSQGSKGLTVLVV